MDSQKDKAQAPEILTDADRLVEQARLRAENRASENARWDDEAEINDMRRLASIGLTSF